MNKKLNQLDQISKENPFKVPEGYFEGLTKQVMANLPERVEETKTVSLWGKIRPWTYMAAMFVGIALMVKVFVGPSASDKSRSTLNLTSAADIEEFYNYYEEQLTKSLYQEEVYDEELDYLEGYDY